MTPDIRGKCMVTGASSGIGKAYARRLAERGHKLVLVARRKAALEDLATEIAAKGGVDAEIIVADLADAADVARLEARLTAGDVGMLVNNAGIGGMSGFLEMNVSAIEQMIAVNVIALTRLTRAAAETMKANGSGVIVNVASGIAFNAMAGASVYAGTKAFVAHFTRSLDLELEGSGIQFQLLVPGLTRTNLGGAEDLGLFDQFPAEIVQSAEDVVTASLAGLEMGELVCLPRVEDYSQWEATRVAMSKVGTDPDHNRLASRYLIQVSAKGGSQ